MPTYELPYAQENLPKLFQEARNGEDVIIVRMDGLSCQLVSLANVKDEAPIEEAAPFLIPGLGGNLAPA